MLKKLILNISLSSLLFVNITTFIIILTGFTNEGHVIVLFGFISNMFDVEGQKEGRRKWHGK